MVRVKSRWMICRIDFERDVILSNKEIATIDLGNRPFPSQKELVTTIRTNIISCFGDAASTAASINATQVRFCDPITRLCIIRVPIEYCTTVRCTLTFITELINRRVAITIDSIHGTARTAKVKAIKTIQLFYRQQILQVKSATTNTTNATTTNVSQKEMNHLCHLMETAVNDINKIG